MRENETKENQGKSTDACDAQNLDKDIDVDKLFGIPEQLKMRKCKR